MLDVTRLRVLVAVARHGSVTAAARALNYAQPSVSHHLARLEAETGARLTQRSGRGIRLTGAGRLLAERAEEVLGRLDAAENELAAYVGQQAERIRLAAFPAALATIVPAAAARLAAQHSAACVALTEAEPAEAIRLLRGGQADLALVFQYTQHSEAASHYEDPAGELWAQLILDEPVHLVTRMTSGKPAGPGLRDYARSRWIAGCEHCRAQLLRQCSAAGFTPDIAVTTDDHVAAQALVAAGLGVTILPALALRAARHPGICAQPLPGTRHQVFAVTHGQPPPPSLAATLIGLLAAAADAPGKE